MYSFRLAEKRDLGAVLMLYGLFTDETPFGYGWFFDKDQAIEMGEMLLEDWINNPKMGHVVIAVEDGEVVGALAHGKVGVEDTFFDTFMYVLKTHRNLGVGNLLHEKAGQLMVEYGVKRVVASAPAGSNHLDILIHRGFIPKDVILEKVVGG